MKDCESPYISTNIILTFIENPQLSLDEFMKDCVKCAVNMNPQHLLNLYVMCYKRTRNPRDIDKKFNYSYGQINTHRKY